MPFDGRTMPGVDLFEACGSRPSESAAAVADAWSLSHGHSADRHALGLEGAELIAAHLAFHDLSGHEAEIHDAGQLPNARGSSFSTWLMGWPFTKIRRLTPSWMDLHLLGRVVRLSLGLRRDDSLHVIFDMAVDEAFGFFRLGHVGLLEGMEGTAKQALHPMRNACFAECAWWRRKSKGRHLGRPLLGKLFLRLVRQ